MKKWLKASLITLICAGIVGTSGHFIGVEVAKNIKLGKATEIFTQKLEDNKFYDVKNLNFRFFDQKSTHTFDLELENVRLKFDSNDEFDFTADLSFSYDFMKIYSGSAVFLDNFFYLTTEESSVIEDDVCFNTEAIKTFRTSFNNSTLVNEGIFDFRFNLDIFDGLLDKIQEVKTKDPSTFLFEFDIKKYNSTIMFYADQEFNIQKLKTLTALEYENTLVSLDASNITFADEFSIEKPTKDFKNLDNLLKGVSDFFNKFDAEQGEGLSIHLGSKDGSKAISLYHENKKFIDLNGDLEIYNKTENEDYLIKFSGNFNLYFDDYSQEMESVSIILKDDIIYIDFGTTIKGSIKSSTIEEIFEINKEQLYGKIRELFYSIVDLAGINYSFDNEYHVINDLNTVNEDQIDFTIAIPVKHIDEENKVFTISLNYENGKFTQIDFEDITYEEYKICDISLSINDELSEKPTIDPKDYNSLDEIVEKLINFNWN